MKIRNCLPGIAGLAIAALTSLGELNAQATVFNVNAAKPQAEIQKTMWGIFFEDINFGADGGIYAELVKNRSFEFTVPMMGWTAANYKSMSTNLQTGAIAIMNTKEPNNSRFARITTYAADKFSLKNTGFFGMGFKQGAKYNFSVDARVASGTQKVIVELVDDKDNVSGSATIDISSTSWTKVKATIESSKTIAKGSLRLRFPGTGSVDFDLFSLLPQDTWKGTNLRKDLVQMLADLKPGFLRFPGGCIVEGSDLSLRYQWKKTLGERDDRELMINRWNTEFKHRPAPDYFQTFSLGYYEYFKLAEDIGASPLPILTCGIACQFNTGELVPMEDIQQYVQDAIDLIEFANGGADTKWGKMRADMGHPAPFNLTMIGIGNEQWGPQYIERYKVFQDALKAKHPEVKIVSAAGPSPDGELFDYASGKLRELKTDIIDEHYYAPPKWFLDNASRYDNYDRKGPKIFAGEYAAQSVATVSPDNKNNWLCALSEAAFMTGLERNAEVVHLASYAPLFAHAEGWQWTPDLIWFNSLNAYATPNYYVQQLYSLNKGTHTLDISSGGKKIAGENGLYASAVLDKASKTVIIKIVNASATEQTVKPTIAGVKLQDQYTASVLAADTSAVNSFEDPGKVKPVEKNFSLKKDKELKLAPMSMGVYRFVMR